jgi:hypothetical protein
MLFAESAEERDREGSRKRTSLQDEERKGGIEEREERRGRRVTPLPVAFCR